MAKTIINIVCPVIANSFTMSDAKPVRITVLGAPQRCRNQAYILNAVINSIKAPVQLDFIQSYGRYDMGKWNGAVGQLVYNMSDVAIAEFTATYE